MQDGRKRGKCLTSDSSSHLRDQKRRLAVGQAVSDCHSWPRWQGASLFTMFSSAHQHGTSSRSRPQI